jgi:hypothetical protein
MDDLDSTQRERADDSMAAGVDSLSYPVGQLCRRLDFQ